MKKILFLLFISLYLNSLAQEDIQTAEDREIFGNHMFDIGEFELSKQVFTELLDSGRSLANVNYRLGLSLMELYSPEEALPYLQEAEKLGFTQSLSHNLKKDRYNKNYYSFDIDFALARGYHLSAQFKEAIKYYQKFLDNPKLLFPDEKKIALLYQAQARVGEQLILKQEEVGIVNMGNRINSEYDEYGALVYRDTSTIIFTRRQPNKDSKSIKIDGSFKEDIYISYKRKDGKWILPFRISESINRDKQDDFAAALHNNDKTLVVQYEGGLLSEFNRVGTTWANTKKESENIIARGITITDKIRIVASTFYGTRGGEDLFVSYLNDNGSWSEFKPLPSSINTEYDESYPFLDPNDLSLYYSANNQFSSGNYDVFKAEYNPLTKTWDKAENIGYPINTPKDDVYFTYHSTSKVAFYNSERNDTYGGLDIYMVDYNKIKSQTVSINLFTKALIDSNLTPISVDFTLKEEGMLEPLKFTTDNLGNISFDVLSNRNYHLKFSNENYEFLDTLIVLTTKLPNYQIDIKLVTLEEGKKYTLSNVQFDRDQAELKEEAFSELGKFYEFLIQHPGLAIEIAGHTEIGGLESQNKVLSQARADAVKEYLVKKGIDSKRMLSVGYGSKFPVTKDNSEESKGLNRRTEVILHHINSQNADWQPYYK